MEGQIQLDCLCDTGAISRQSVCSRQQGVIVVGLEMYVMFKIRVGRMREENRTKSVVPIFAIRGFLCWRIRFRTVFDPSLFRISLLVKCNIPLRCLLLNFHLILCQVPFLNPLIVLKFEDHRFEPCSVLKGECSDRALLLVLSARGCAMKGHSLL